MPKFRLKIEKIEEQKDKEVLQPSKEELEAKHEALKKQKSVISWKSVSRPYKKRQPQYFLTAGLVAIFFILLSILIQEYLAIGVIIAALFVAYVLALVEPDEIDHKITKEGIVSGSHAYLWEELRSFWFGKKYGREILVLETRIRFPARVILVLGGVNNLTVKEILSKSLEFREAPLASWLDKFTDDLASKLPFEPK